MTRKQRILHIIDTLDRTGTAQQLPLLALGLPRDEFETHVCALSRGGPIGDALAAAGIPVHGIGRRWSADPTTFWQLLRLVKELRPDAIHGWQASGRAYAAAVAGPGTCAAGGLAGDCGVRNFVAVWREVEAQRWPLQRIVDRYVGRRASTVVATCPAVRDYCIGQGISSEKIAVIPSGVCTAGPPAATRGQILARLGLPESVRLIGWAGRLEPDRGGKDAIWAADLLKVIRDDVHLLIFGAGPHRERLVRFRDQVEIADKVHFLGNRGDYAEFLPHFDQFWSTRRLPGQSQAILEALAVGVPVVATDIPGTRELIEHAATGYLVAPGHRAGFARWSEYLLNHPVAARQIGAAGRQRVEQEFSAEGMVREWRKIISRSSRPRSGERQ